MARRCETTWLNLAGSVAFGASAVAAYVVPGSSRVLDVAVVDMGTFLGALCFLAGALLMAPAAPTSQGRRSARPSIETNSVRERPPVG